MRRAGDDARGRGDVLGAGATDSFLFQLLCSGLSLSNGLLCGLFLGGFSRLRLGDLLRSLLDPGLGDAGRGDLGLFVGGALTGQGGASG